MILKKWNDLPDKMKNNEVRKYYELLCKRKLDLFIKRIFDITTSLLLLIMLSPIFIIVSILIKIDSNGPIIFKQIRITQYERKFQILKFRTMVNNAEKLGSQVTTMNDKRVTRIGKLLRKFRIDEIPQLINILKGEMTFVGTRPEVQKYVDSYNEEMYATLLIRAGVTSKASILFKDEEKLLQKAINTDKTYIEEILTKKMNININSLNEFSFLSDIWIMLKTVLAIIKI